MDPPQPNPAEILPAFFLQDIGPTPFMWASMCQEDDATRSAAASITTVAPEVVAVAEVEAAPSADPEVWPVVRARTTSARSNRKWSDQVRQVSRIIAASGFPVQI